MSRTRSATRTIGRTTILTTRRSPARRSPARRATAVGAAALGAVGALVLAGTAALPSQAATTTWVATGTQGLTLTDATSLGAAPAGRAVHLAVSLAPRHATALSSLIKAQATPGSPAYEHFLTPAQFTSVFSPTASQAQQVASYLTGAGFADVTVGASRLTVTADGTAAEAASAFHTTLTVFDRAGSTVLANTTPALVPTALGGLVQSVLGLQDEPMTTPHATPTLPSIAGFTPAQLGTAYDDAGTRTGSASSIAVIAEGNLAPTVKDLRTAERANHLPQVPVTLVPTGLASPDTSGADEWDLDTQTSTGVAGTVKNLYIYVASSLTDADLYRSISRFASDDKAQAGSASLGECDLLAYASGAMFADDTVLAEAAAQGQTFFASAGDTGSSCAVLPTNGVPGSGIPDTEYPASGEYTVGVGGTTLLAGATGAYQSEVAWNAGGGGISALETPGYWTNSATASLGVAVRGVPDVAADADPNTGALIYVNGVATAIGGTSLSSPLWLGVWARVQSAHANTLGFAPITFYGLYTAANTGATVPTDSVAFHDVVLGSNGLYTALPGYDETTGLGTPDIAKLDSLLK